MKTSEHLRLSLRLVLIIQRQCVCCEECAEVEERTEHRASNTIDCECVESGMKDEVTWLKRI